MKVLILMLCIAALRGQCVGSGHVAITSGSVLVSDPECASGQRWIEFKGGWIVEPSEPSKYEYDIGTATLHFTDKHLRNVYHEKWQYINGTLRILKPMTILDMTGRSKMFQPDQAIMDAKPEPQGEAGAPKTICGTNAKDPTPNITLLQISCVDYDAWKRVSPEIPWPTGRRTNVLVHVLAGDAVRVTLGGDTKWADLVPHQDGAQHAIIQFDGTEHTAFDVRVFTEAK